MADETSIGGPRAVFQETLWTSLKIERDASAAGVPLLALRPSLR